MNELSLLEIARATEGKILKGDEKLLVSSVEIDSRRVKAGGLFIAIKGEKQDGHSFIQEAVKRGIKAALVEKPGDYPLLDAVILVKDGVKALQDLSSWYLASLDIKKIGITGSVGKTSTKDFLDGILSEEYETRKTVGNFNNHIGLPLTILTLDNDSQIGIFEMGMDKEGEIDFLASLLKPDIGIITSVGYSHLEKLGTRENILKAKLEIRNYFGPDNLLVINDDSDLLTREAISGNYKILTAGVNGKSDYVINNIDDKSSEGVSFDLERKGESFHIKLPVPGRHNAINATLALVVGEALGVSIEKGKLGLAKTSLTEKRLNILTKRGIKVIDDSYNASPESVKSALEVLSTRKGLRHIAILGDMFELGEKSPEHHLDVGRYAGFLGVDFLVTIGELSYNIYLGAEELLGRDRIFHYKTKKEFFEEMTDFFLAGDVVLIKGSRAMEMEEIGKHILKD